MCAARARGTSSVGVTDGAPKVRSGAALGSIGRTGSSPPPHPASATNPAAAAALMTFVHFFISPPREYGE